MKKLILFVLFFCCFPFYFSVASEQLSSSLFDAVDFAKGGGITVDLQEIERLLNEGANPNWIKQENGKSRSVLKKWVDTIAFCASDVRKDPSVEEKGVNAIKLLFDHSAKLQYCDGSILLFPISFGQYDVVKILLEKGASATSWAKAEIGYNYNFTPIEQATASGHDKIIELLVSYGATKINEKDAAQLRFIDLAGFGTISDLKEQIKKGADVNTCNSNDETALLRALDQIFYSYDSYLKILYLLDLGADVNLKCGGGGPPLHLLIDKSSFLAQHKQDPKCVKKAQESIKNGENILQELIKRGAHISGKDEDGKTPLHIAAEYNHLYAARLLLRSGSKVMPKDNSGKTPLDYAESAEMIKLLKEHGAKEQ